MRVITFDNSRTTVYGDVKAGVKYVVPVSIVDMLCKEASRTGQSLPLVVDQGLLSKFKRYEKGDPSVFLIATDAHSTVIPSAIVARFLKDSGVKVAVMSAEDSKWAFEGNCDEFTSNSMLEFSKLASCWAAARPAGPEPTMATRLPVLCSAISG